LDKKKAGRVMAHWYETSISHRPETAQACLLWDGAQIWEGYHFLPQIDDRFFGIWPEIWCHPFELDLPFKAVTHWRPVRGA